MADIVLYKNIN